MDKLTLEHLAPYLPYGLKVKYNKSAFYISSVSIDISAVIKLERYHNHRYYNEVWLIEDNRFKPILRPLSDLTKEIEHNGERFVPCQMFRYEIDCMLSNMDVDIYCQPYTVINQLISWHFDVFGLIEKGLAISTDTLGKEVKGDRE